MIEAAVPRAVARLLRYTHEREDELTRPLVQPQPTRYATFRASFRRPANVPLGLAGFHPRIEVQASSEWGATHSGSRILGVGIVATAYVDPRVTLTAESGEIRLRDSRLPSAVELQYADEVPHPPHPSIYGVSLWELTPVDLPHFGPTRRTHSGAFTDASEASGTVLPDS